MGEVAKGGAGVLEAGGVGGVGGGEGVAGGHGVLHEALPLLASRHRFLVLDLGLIATHPERAFNPWVLEKNERI